MQYYNFTVTLYMMRYAQPKLSRLSGIFQLSTLDMSELHKPVPIIVEGLCTFGSNLETGKKLKFEYTSIFYTS